MRSNEYLLLCVFVCVLSWKAAKCVPRRATYCGAKSPKMAARFNTILGVTATTPFSAPALLLTRHHSRATLWVSSQLISAYYFYAHRSVKSFNKEIKLKPSLLYSHFNTQTQRELLNPYQSNQHNLRCSSGCLLPKQRLKLATKQWQKS